MLSLLHAPVFAWAAIVLPWRAWTVFSVFSGVVALSHLLTAVAAALAHRRLPLVWRVGSALSLAFGAYLAWTLISSAWYVGATYKGLGEGVAAALGAVVGLVVLVTVPVAVWGIAATGGIRRWKGLAAGLLVMAVLVSARLWGMNAAGDGTRIATDARVGEVMAALDGKVDVDTLPRGEGARVALMTSRPARCEAPPSAARITLVATFLTKARNGKPFADTRCFQADGAADAVDAFAAEMKRDALRGPIKLDLVTHTFALPDSAPLAESLAFRPGLDGACGANGHCLMPWQLVALDAFVSEMPIPSIPDVRLGLSGELLRKRLADPALTRIATRSWLLPRGGGVIDQGRQPSAEVAVTTETLEAASNDAAKYVYLAQKRDGKFKYIVMPYSGRLIDGSFSIARQAGTTLSACELAKQEKWVKRLADRSLGLLAKHEAKFSIAGQEAGVLRWRPKGSVERLGPTALSLVALIACRHRVGDGNDQLMVRLARTLLAVQRDDGSFHHYIDIASGEPVVKKGSIYVDGQIIMALTMFEALAGETGLFDRERLHDAVERAMTYFGTDYWDIPLEPFLYIEENWHCLAAAAALEHHRNDAYEQFCLDYVAMKTRIIHDPGSAVHEDFIGGYGFGNVVPPHNAATGGYGEALAAAIKIKKKRGMDVTEDSERMMSVLAFLLRNQWTRAACFACTPKHRIVGGFSEHMASSRIRIDYVQHVWAAIGHGARALGLIEEPA